MGFLKTGKSWQIQLIHDNLLLECIKSSLTGIYYEGKIKTYRPNAKCQLNFSLICINWFIMWEMLHSLIFEIKEQ